MEIELTNDIIDALQDYLNLRNNFLEFYKKLFLKTEIENELKND